MFKPNMPKKPSLVPTSSGFRALWSKLFTDSRLHDMTFVCQHGVIVTANRAALAAACAFFDVLLYSSGMRETTEREVLLPSTSAECLRVVLAHLETGQTSASLYTADLEHVLQCYEMARLYTLDTLEADLLKALRHLMRSDNVGRLLTVAQALAAEELEALAVDYLSRSWSLGTRGTSSIHGLSPCALAQIWGGSQRVSVPPEHVLEALVEWAAEQLHLECSTEEAGEQLARLIGPLLRHIDFERMPAHFLESRVEPLGLLSMEQLIQLYRHQAKIAAPPPCMQSTTQQSFWDVMEIGSTISLVDASTLVFNAAKGHQAARSRLCLTQGRWKWALHIERVGRKYAWAGLVDSTCSLEFFPGSQAGGFMFGSAGCTRTKAAGKDEEDYGSYWHRDGSIITVLLDMDRRQCSYSVDGVPMGVAFSGLPKEVYPAVSLSGGGTVRFLSLDAGDEI